VSNYVQGAREEQGQYQNAANRIGHAINALKAAQPAIVEPPLEGILLINASRDEKERYASLTTDPGYPYTILWQEDFTW